MQPILHLSIPVRDMEEASAFYVHTLGCQSARARAGFTDVRCVDQSRTTVEEQRATQWMRYQSLPEFLDPHDPTRTIEGLPAPLRATLVARKP